MKSHIIGFLLVTLAQIPMPIKIGTFFQNKLLPNIHLLPKVAAGGAVDQVDRIARNRVESEVKVDFELSLHGGDGLVNIGRGDNWKIKKKYE